MFTGIVEHIGTIESYIAMDTTKSGGEGVSITIKDASSILTDCHIGDSIAVNGICLTVTEFDKDSFKVGISPETIKRTNVQDWTKGRKVNLERAVSQDVRFGGHYVQGHVDTVANIISRENEDNSIIFGFKLRDKEYMKYIVEKGFICVDGTSLTVIKVDNVEKSFYISMIKHTQDNVVMPLKQLNDLVNIEVDLFGKIIEKQIEITLEDQIENKNSPLYNLLESLIEKKVEEVVSRKK
ncbi:hypothetical protein TBLA_0D04570 [Henningerozyma blattae CBS 6284]|uniref:Riboflavin synthase n=1 Tax=Henningerozyma blattae (strain ATCC 34711 / CBS 6284 / DSM 70876 / NBRC 10599 / NRRL Y-10934 / UCD 77-7) TaxID=1071380 RepID=I2H3K1_HENB6|nr:hypothetical protein TBLA_0D04570 [Tetrapisispora blattae CBS 6284]CCH60953.1 hypothetical protein TBLA_0D04570 [Tetrapisispora blattae CBS 6284]